MRAHRIRIDASHATVRSRSSHPPRALVLRSLLDQHQPADLSPSPHADPHAFLGARSPDQARINARRDTTGRLRPVASFSTGAAGPAFTRGTHQLRRLCTSHAAGDQGPAPRQRGGRPGRVGASCRSRSWRFASPAPSAAVDLRSCAARACGAGANFVTPSVPQAGASGLATAAKRVLLVRGRGSLG
jgi:hypothetical protein